MTSGAMACVSNGPNNERWSKTRDATHTWQLLHECIACSPGCPKMFQLHSSENMALNQYAHFPAFAALTITEASALSSDLRPTVSETVSAHAELKHTGANANELQHHSTHKTQITFLLGYNPPASKHVYLLKLPYIHNGSLSRS